jgi:phage N-6-adenine-methyltransferase
MTTAARTPSLQELAMTPDEARQLTNEIKSATERLWSLLLQAYEGRAWQALGYESWRAWATAEFDYSQSHAYRMLDQARVIHALTEATGSVSPIGEISEYEAREIKPRLGEAVEDVRELVDEGMPPRQAVDRIVEKYTATPHVARASGDNEWYTPAQFVEAARLVLGEIDLDPASSERANEIVNAATFYTAEDNGLEQEWTGRAWMNPPYASDLIGPFTEKMAQSYEGGEVEAAIVLVNNATETQWFQRLAGVAKAICFPERRVRFWNTDGDLGAPLQGQAFLYLGEDADAFTEQFMEFGIVVEVRSA